MRIAVFAVMIALGAITFSSGAARAANCKPGWEQNGLLCYPLCRGGFKGAGPVCWQQCPSGFPDQGAFCGKPGPYGRGGGYPWKFGDGFNLNGATARCERAHGRGRCEKSGLLIYPKCRAGFHAVGCCICSPDCPSGMRDIGVSCAKGSYGRGAGQALETVKKFFKDVGNTIKTGLNKVGEIATKVWTGITGGIQAVTSGIVKVFLQLKGLIECVARKSRMDVVKLFNSVVSSPFGFIKDTISGTLPLVGGVVSNVVTKGAESTAALVSAFSAGKVPPPQALHAFGDWVWGQFEALATKVGALECLMPFVRPVRGALRTAFGWVASTALPLIGQVYKTHVEPKLTPLLAKALDAGVKLIVGQKWKDRLKSMAARIFDPATQAKEAAKRLKAFLKLVKSGKGDLKKAWLDARAHISSAKDFGARKLALVAREAIKFLIEVLIDKLAPRVVEFGIKAVSTGVTFLNRVVDAACGLIPEVGAGICVFVTGALRLLYTFVGSTVLKTMIMKGIDWVLKPVVNMVVNLVASKVEGAVTRMVDKQVSGNKLVGNLATIFQPLIDLVFNVITKWALPDAKSAGAFNGLVAKVGDQVLEMALEKRRLP